MHQITAIHDAFCITTEPEIKLKILEIIFLGIMLNIKIEIFFPPELPLSSIRLSVSEYNLFFFLSGKGRGRKGLGLLRQQGTTGGEWLQKWRNGKSHS